MTRDWALDVQHLTIETDAGAVIVDDVGLRVRAGETIAIVGESGSGKSVTARAITGLLPAGLSTTGHIQIDGRSFENADEKTWRSARGSAITWLPQDPFTMLSPLRNVKSAISDGIGTRIPRDELVKRLNEVGINDESVARKYPFQLSGGIRQRVGIACALSSDPRILVADEPTTALDVTSQRKVLSLMREVQRARGLALVLITHDLPVALSIADRIYVMYAGTVVEEFAPGELANRPLHPYTQSLLMADPPVDRKVARLASVAGGVPTPGDRRAECVFKPRCDYAIEDCAKGRPLLVEVGNRRTACVRSLDLTLPAHRASECARDRNSGPIVLSASRIKKRFGEHEALRGVTIEARRGQIVGIVGGSGSGKTTLARIIAGLEVADEGVVETPMETRERCRAKPVQMVFQDPSGTLNPSQTVGKILRNALAAGSMDSRPSDAVALLSLVGLPGSFADRKASSLSGGQRQRVAIARALGPRSQVLLCDEPTSALDVMVQAQVLNLLRDLRDELDVAMVFVTHDLGVARQMTDYLYVLERGHCVEHGPTERVFDDPQHEYTRELLRGGPTYVDGPMAGVAAMNH
ncbi:Glutathione import ATP-binding protein GsiA [Rhodococcus erythropolis]|uniref:dipeptide ABC transporter ATP-binding protein n=1 Tax=Rhodococcus erythropolis TaxID=1833 RepID=UPI000BB398DB|nr:Glutathione import ATP-binding protein GsiA [Rhodococcus erythropolis]